MSTENLPHQDSSRAGVGRTAHGVAIMRSWESQRGVAAMINDPFAADLGGEVGENWLNTDFVGQEHIREGMVNGIAVRTKKLDTEILAALKEEGFKQVCVLGAGLDTRPWRLHLIDESLMASEEFKNVLWIEADFPAIIDFKMQVINSHNGVTPFNYQSVKTDLSIPTWTNLIHEVGLRSDVPTLWLLEGFTTYLTEEELTNTFRLMNSISAPGSRLLATFLGVGSPMVIKEHRFLTDEPLEFVQRFHWDGHVENFMDIFKNLAADRPFPSHWGKYYFAKVNFHGEK